MFQPHSPLWHYLWVAPNLLLAILAIILWRRGLHRQFRSFVIYAGFQAFQWSVLYSIDVLPYFSGEDFWRVTWFTALLECPIVFILVSDIFADVFGNYEALSQLGKRVIRWASALLVIIASAIAAYAPIENPKWLIHGTHVLREAMYIVVAGLILLLFVAAAYFRLAWNHRIFGIAVGLGITACIHVATWAVIDNAGLLDHWRNILDFVNMTTTHVVVLIWFYYFLVPHKVAAKTAVSLPENALAVWNRELERLLQP
jgi:hypothetical protein